jgi:hypothetical protein
MLAAENCDGLSPIIRAGVGLCNIVVTPDRPANSLGHKQLIDVANTLARKGTTMPAICKLNITVKTITVHSNGQPPVQLAQSEISSLSNAIAATILYPNSFSSSVAAAVAPTLVNANNTDITFNFDLANPDGAYPPDPAHPAARLCRYLILDDTDGAGSPLFIDVTETVKASALAKAFGMVLGSALNGAASLVPGGAIATGALTGLAGGIGTLISTALGQDNLSVIGSAQTVLHAADLLAAGSREIQLQLTSGKNPISQNWFVPGLFDADGSPVESGDTVLIPANSNNGSITLELQAFPYA